MELLICAAGAGLGFMMNNNGRKGIDYDVNISPSNIPSGNGTIYDSNRTLEMKNQEMILAEGKYRERVKRTFPYDYQKPNSVYPNTNEDSHAKMGYFDSKGSAQSNFIVNLNQTLQKDSNFSAFNPVTSNYDPGQVSFIQPLNNNIHFQDNTIDSSGNNISSLSGQQVKWTHTNMNPYFGKSKKQQGVSNENALTLLEKYSGTPSVEPQGTYSQKREVLKPFPNNPENPFKANIDQLKDRYDRANNAVGSTGKHTYITPIKPSRDLPFHKDTRPLPGNIDNTRGIGNQKYSYQPGVTGGKKTSVRAMATTLPEPRKVTTFHHYQPEDFIPNRSNTTSKSQSVNPLVRNVAGTLEYKNDYYGPRNEHIKTNSNDTQQTSMAYGVNHGNVTKRLDSYQGQLGAKTSAVKSILQPGGFQLKEGYKGYSVPVLQGHLENMGSYVMNNDTPDPTIKDTTSLNTVGAINPSGFKDNTGYKFELDGIDLDVTFKSLFSENKYAGQPHQDFGNGIRKQTIEEFATIKETNLFNSTKEGTAKSFIPKHMSYESVYETGKEIIHTDRNGPAPKKEFHTKSPLEGLISMDHNKISTENYIGIAGSIIPKDLHRETFNDSVENNFNPVDFGGKLQNGKFANGDDAKRLQAYLSKTDSTVEGRFNPVLGYDNRHDRPIFETELKNDLVPEKHDNVNKVQSNNNRLPPKTVITNNNSATVNNRLDSSLRITNDLYPWLKK